MSTASAKPLLMPNRQVKPLKLTWNNVQRLITEHTEEIVSRDLVPDPCVSVYLVAYNHAPYIQQALDGVLAQETEFPFEIVLGDDCSSDGTTQIAEAYQRNHPTKIRLLKSNQCLGKHTGNGRVNSIRILQSARGRYVALLDGDDYWCDKAKLQSQIDAIQADDQYVASFHDTDILADGVQRPWREHPDQQYFTQSYVVATLSPFHTSSFLFQRNLLENLPERLLNVQSLDMTLFTFVSQYGAFCRIPKTMSVYRKHAGGITNAASSQGWRLQLERYAMWKNLRHTILAENVNQYDAVVRQHFQSVTDHTDGIQEVLEAYARLGRSLPLRSRNAFLAACIYAKLRAKFAGARATTSDSGEHASDIPVKQ